MNANGTHKLPSRARRPATPRTSLLSVLWRGPLYAIPFALFFGMLMGGSWAALVGVYKVSLIFTYTNGLMTWAVRWFVIPALGRGDTQLTKQRKILRDVACYFAAALVGSLTAALIIHLTIFPGFLGSPRQFAVLGMFTLLFAAVFIGVSYSYHFYQDSLTRARSEEELNLARRIQRSFLLSNFPSRPGIEMHALNVSSKQVSGDFYDVVPAGDRAFLLCIADVSGKGVPAALLGSMLQASLRTHAPITTSVGTMMSNVNGLLCQGVANGQFATMFLARVDEDAMRLDYVNAGHNHPVLFRAGGERVVLDKGGPMVGIIDDVPFEQGSVALLPGDRIVLYTDGLSEAMDRQKEMYGDERLVDLAGSLPAELSARESIDSIVGALTQFLDGEEPQDDMTLMIVRVLGSATPGATAPAAPALAALPAGGAR